MSVLYAAPDPMQADLTRAQQTVAPADDVADLVRRIADGDLRAEEDLVLRFSRGLVLMLRRLARDPYLADDLHQETLRLVLERARAGAIREPERIAGFIRATARNLFIADRRKAARYSDGADAEAAADAPNNRPEEAEPAQLGRVLHDEEARQVRKLLGELRFERDRQLLIRFYLSDDSPRQICADLDIDPPRLRKVMHRARQRLRELWERSQKRQQLHAEPP